MVVAQGEAEAGGGVAVGAEDGGFAGSSGHEFSLPFHGLCFGEVGLFL